MPDKLVKIDNPDKKLHCLDSRYGELGFSFPALILIVGKRGSSKTTCALNIIGKSRYAGKPFDRIVIWHGDPSGTEEYRILTDDGATIVGELPPMDSWDNAKRNVLVVDEVNFLAFNRAENAAFERYVNYGVSHKSLSMLVIVQDMRNLSPCVKRSADYLLLYPSFNNYDVLYDLKRKTGHNYVELMRLCGPKDNITTAFNGIGPPLRRNIFEVININDDADSD